MSRTMRGFLGCAGVIALAAGCAGNPAAPFDQMKTANVTAFRLQNWEPPPTPVTAAPAAAAGAIPGLPPQIQQWIQQGAQGLQQLIPPGLLPPGMVPQGATPTTPAPMTPDASVPRFPTDSTPNYRILGQQPVMDEELREKLADILGDEDSFQAQHGGCLYPEFGVSFVTPPQPPINVLISFSCGQAQGRNFAWPHPYTGLKDNTVRDLREVIAKIFPPGT
jgi:hypothetical protein